MDICIQSIPCTRVWPDFYKGLWQKLRGTTCLRLNRLGGIQDLQTLLLLLNGRIHAGGGLPIAQVQADPDDNAEALVAVYGLAEHAAHLQCFACSVNGCRYWAECMHSAAHRPNVVTPALSVLYKP